MDDEISRKAVLVLVIVAVVISLLSTSLVLNTVYTVPGEGGVVQPSGGRVTLIVPDSPPASRVILEVP